MLKLCFLLLLITHILPSNCLSHKNNLEDVEAFEERKIISYIQNYITLSNDPNKTSNSKLSMAVVDRAETKCLLQVSHFVEKLTVYELWAMRMFDSWGKIQSGILSGNLVNFGDYDQCVGINEKIDDDFVYTVRGKHCMVFYKALPQGDAGTVINMLETEKLKAKNRKNKSVSVKKMNLQFGAGFCLPDTCSGEFIQEFANSLLNEIGFETVYNYDQDLFCGSLNEGTELFVRDYFAILFFISCIILLISSTTYDLWIRRMKQKPNGLFSAFSIYSNAINMFHRTNSTAATNDRLECLNGIRGLSLIWIVFSHRYAYSLLLPITNLTYLPLWLQKWYSPIVTAAPIAVDSFFVLSGLLVTNSLLMELNQQKKINILRIYLHRMLRLTPALGAMIIFLVSIMKLIGSGPYYKFVIDTLAQDCVEYWWSALLFTQNYVNSNNMCITHSWYLSIDMQLYLFAPFIAYGLWQWGKKFAIFLSFLILASACYVFTISVYYEFPVFPPLRQDLEALFNFLVYYPTHTRMGAWLVGALLGYVLFYCKRITVTFPKKVVIISWTFTVCIILVIVFGIYPLHQMHDVQISKWKTALYISLVHSGWSLALGYIIFLCSCGYGGFVNTFLSLPQWRPICKLSYCIYLTHVYVQIYLIANQHSAGYFNDMEFLHLFWGDICFSVIIALLWALTFERPIRNLEEYLMGMRGTRVLPLI